VIVVPVDEPGNDAVAPLSTSIVKSDDVAVPPLSFMTFLMTVRVVVATPGVEGMTGQSLFVKSSGSVDEAFGNEGIQGVPGGDGGDGGEGGDGGVGINGKPGTTSLA